MGLGDNSDSSSSDMRALETQLEKIVQALDSSDSAAAAAAHGFDTDAVAAANSVLEVVQMASPVQAGALAHAVAHAARDTVITHLRDAPVAVEVVVISREGQMLGRSGALTVDQMGPA